MMVAWYRSTSFKISVLLLLFTACAAFASYYYHIRMAEEQVTKQAASLMYQSMSRLQSGLEYLLNAGDQVRVQEDVASLGTDARLEYAIVVDNSGRILASLQRVHLQQHISEALQDMPVAWRNKLSQWIDAAQKNMDARVMFNETHTAVVGVYPLHLAANSPPLRGSLNGAVLVQRSLVSDRLRAEQALVGPLSDFLFVLVLFSILLIVASHFSFTRRVKRLIEASAQFAQGDFAARARLKGEDELTVIGRSFDEMAQKVATTHRRLEYSEQRVRLLLESTKEAIFAINLVGRCNFFNTATTELLGFAAHTDLIGEHLIELLINQSLPKSQVIEIDKILAEFAQGAANCVGQLTLKRMDDTVVQVEYRAYPIHQLDELAGVVFSLLDITLRSDAEQELRLAASVFEHSHNGIIITDAHSRILRINEAFCEITGFRSAEAIGKKVVSLLHSGHHDRDFYRQMKRAIVEEGRWRGEVWGRRQDGSEFPSWQNISAVLNELGDVVAYISIFSDNTERRMAEQHIERLAHYDALTDLPNRLLFNDRLENALPRCERRKSCVALLFVDLDRFKYINDTLGHPAGDHLLHEIGQRLKACVRKEDTVARIGGDEFTVILEGVPNQSVPVVIANKILASVALPVDFQGQSLFVGASIGISIFPKDGVDSDSLIKNADTAMYKAKELGRNRYVLYAEELSVCAESRFNLERDLRLALERNEFILHYQAQVGSDGHSIEGVEALVRWVHPDGRLVSPLDFLGVAADIGLIAQIDHFVLKTACRQLQQWHAKLHPSLRIAVNLSGVQINDASIVTIVRQAINATGLDPRYLELEITEEFVMSNPERSINALCELREIGVSLAIDDFGTGHSSLGYLKKLPINRLKIDRSFVRDILVDKDDATIVAAIIAMAKQLDLITVGEGVESAEQLSVLRELGCDEFQGYYFNRPVSAQDFSRFLECVSVQEN